MSNYTRFPDPASGIKIYPSAANFPVTGQDGQQAVAADTNTIYVYDTSVPGWQPVANPGSVVAITALMSDVTATGPGAVNATVNSVGGAAAVDIATSVSDTQAATDANVASTLVKRDSSGKSSFYEVEAVTFESNDGVNLSATLGWNGVQVTNAGTGISNLTSNSLDFNDGTSSAILATTSLSFIANSGNTAASLDAITPAVNVESAVSNFRSTLSSGILELYSDKNAPYSLTINGTIPEQATFTLLDTGVLDPYFYFTAVNNPNTWVQCNNFKADSGYGASVAINPTGLALTNNSQILTINSNPAATQTYSITLPPAQGGAGTALLNDGGGNLSWGTAGMANPMTTAGDIIVGGASGTPGRLALGTVDKVLVSDGTTVSYQYAGLGGGALGTNNVVLGRSKPSGITTATDLIAIGASASNSVTAGSAQIAIGTSALAANAQATQAGGSVAVGYQALAAATTITFNAGSGLFPAIAIGYQSAYLATTATNSISIGYRAQRGTNILDSMAIGNNTGNSGAGVIAIGNGTLQASSANDNHVIGFQSATSITSGAGNVGIGLYCLREQATGSVAVTTGGYNTALGNRASTAAANTTGSISLGASAVAASNEFAVGSASYQINTMLLGRGGATQTAANAVKIMTMRASGTTDTSMTAGTLTLAGSQGTGTGAGGDVIIATAPASTTGSTTNAHVERLRVTATGNVQVPNYILSPQLFDAGTQTGNFSLDLGANGPCQQATINAAGPLVITLSNPVTGGAYLIKLVQGATPGTVTWPVNVKWGTAGVPTLSNIAGKIDIINLYYDGTDYFGTYALGY